MARIWRQSVPWLTAMGLLVKNLISGSPKKKNMTATKAKKHSAKNALRHTDFAARSGCFAPRFCPVSVAAALAIPQAGNIVKMQIRIAVKYPAVASTPDSAIIFAKNIQLQLPIRN